MACKLCSVVLWNQFNLKVTMLQLFLTFSINQVTLCAQAKDKGKAPETMHQHTVVGLANVWVRAIEGCN